MVAKIIANRYQLEQIIGQGGMGTVYEALDTRLKRKVAIKVIKHENESTELAQLFNQEAHAIARLHHTNILMIYDYSGPEESPLFMVTELIHGLSLAQCLDHFGSLPEDLCCTIGYGIASALEHAHKQGIIHRDLKPSNIMLENSGRVLLMDFGIAKTIYSNETEKSDHLRGTPDFMSPEQILGESVETASDIFSLGSLLYTSTCTRTPFYADKPTEVMRNIAYNNFEPLRAHDIKISRQFEHLIESCLQSEPADRPSATFLAQRLNNWLFRRGHKDSNEIVRLYLQHPPTPKNKQSYVFTSTDHASNLFGTTGSISKSLPRAITSIKMDEEDTVVDPTATPSKLDNVRSYDFNPIPPHLRIQNASKKSSPRIEDETSGINWTYFFIPIFFITIVIGSLMFLPKMFKNSTAPLHPENQIVWFDVQKNGQNPSALLTIHADPWAILFIDDKRYGKISTTRTTKIAISTGKHSLKLENPDFQTQKHILNLKADETKQLFYKLRK